MTQKINGKRWLTLGICMAMLLSILCLTGCGKHSQDSVETLAEKTAKVLMKEVAPEEADWVAFGLGRWEDPVSEDWINAYYHDVQARAAACKGVFHERKYTENAKVILALTAIGKDPTDVGGYNLLVPFADFDQTVLQGINGAVYGLLALDSGCYEIPENVAGPTQATREMYVDYILKAQLPSGGWALSGDTAEVDLTAMVLQALSKYRAQESVDKAITQSLTFLSESQNADGGFTYFGAQTCESVVQTMVALTELGISLEDPRFVKNENTLLDALLRFRQKDGTFSHFPDGKTDMIATEQAFYALVAAERLAQGETALYCMK